MKCLFGCELLAIDDDGRFRLVFQTPNGIQRRSCRYLIMAIPANQYRTIKGWMNLEIESEKKLASESLQLGATAKWTRADIEWTTLRDSRFVTGNPAIR